MTGTEVAVFEQPKPIRVFTSVRNMDYDQVQKKMDAEMPEFESTFPGDALTFDGKRGQWRWGHGKKGIPFDHNSVSFVMNVPNAVEGWQRFIVDPTSGKLRPMIVGMVAVCDPTQTLIDRDQLGDNDPTAWATDNWGKQQDPWKRFIAIPLRIDGKDEMQHMFVSSISTVIATKGLIQDFAKLGRSNMGKLPVVNVGKTERQNKKGETYDVPSFEICAWIEPTAADEPAAAEQAASIAAIPEASVTANARTTVEKLQEQVTASAAKEVAAVAATVAKVAEEAGATPPVGVRRTAPATGVAPPKPTLFAGAKGTTSARKLSKV